MMPRGMLFCASETEKCDCGVFPHWCDSTTVEWVVWNMCDNYTTRLDFTSHEEYER